MIKLLFLLFLLAGCYGTSYTAMDRREAYISRTPNLSQARQNQIKQGQLSIGMTTEEVAASVGEPRRKNTSGGAYGLLGKVVKREQWVYQRSSISPTIYLYFRNGVLKSWQKID